MGHSIRSLGGEENIDAEERNTIDFFDGCVLRMLECYKKETKGFFDRVIREHDDINVFTAAGKVDEDGACAPRRSFAEDTDEEG